ncbi:hypothetical protein [Thalassovita aquimarina]|uniref:Glycosyltransferase RgtA/B/C/D-like domain-containing protein n=1 Tax=Thalassovita aquimarina TaxID=2785917 RepID=A0ABS5HN17_9RHOB|nr:hypothetical protein [Thalassovita aquimarina]MBR9650355.1 hypothetical protein [Thalassovita aquimarina]
MTSERRKLFDTPGSYRLAFSGALLFYALIQLKVAPEYLSAFRLPDIDDEMRLVMVRDLLAGQGWSDMVQYRALPPDGLPMHWSRLVDLPLAALTVLFSRFTDQMTALQITAAIWPVALFVLYLSIIGRTMVSAIGYAQASFSVMAAAATPSVASTFFALGRVDHHNLQIVCMTAALALILRSGNPVRRGMAAGLISAFSLAVGLETIVFFALLGVVLSLAYVFDRPGSVEKLGGYGFALGLFAPLFFVLQTAPQDWTVARCDQLSPITLALTTLAAGFALLLARLRHRVRSRTMRFGLVAVLGAAMFAVLWPGLAPCREGSFSTLPPEVAETIRAGISESLSLSRMFVLSPPTAIQAVLPYLVLAGALILYLLSGANRRRLALTLLAFVLLAVAGMFYQIRTILWGHPALPMGFGIVMVWMLAADWKGVRWGRPLSATAVFVLVLFPSIPVWAGFETFARGGARGDGGRAGVAPVKRSCTDPSEIARLNGLPPSGILAPLDFGTKLLLYTHHSVFALPYHRRPEAYVNGTLAFYGDEAGLAAKMDETGADYVMVCAGMTYASADSIGSMLARGERPDGLERIMEAGDLTVFKRKEN